MKLVRFYAFGRTLWGEAHDNGIAVFKGNPYDGTLEPEGKSISWDVAHLLPPATPTKIVCIGSNYRKHCEEMGRPVPSVPKLFLKPPSALIGHEGIIELPADVGRVDFEGELAVVVGRTARRVSPQEAPDYLLGTTILNDVTAREIQRADIQFTRGKGYDTFCPVGPVLDTEVNPSDLAISTRVNGEIRQNSRTSDMIFDVPNLVSFISHVMTLCPGDIITTGTPSGVGPLTAGDTVEVTLEGVGTLVNEVRG